VLQPTQGKKLDLISKITRAKIAGGVVPVVEHLPSKHKFLSSNPNDLRKGITIC
jgi:hypothetical protein